VVYLARGLGRDGDHDRQVRERMFSQAGITIADDMARNFRVELPA
jgi:hypothetical protein